MNQNRFTTTLPRFKNTGNRFCIKDEAAKETTLPAAQTKKTKCQQFSEFAIEDDAFVLDVLEFFFDERLQPAQLNDTLRDLAATCVWEATKGSKAMDLVPKPTGTLPDFKWLVKQAVQIAFRASQNKCFYEAVRVTIKRNFRSAYELAKMESQMQSAYTRPFSGEMILSDQGVDFIKRFEGFRSALYDDPVGHCTIGYGTLVHRGNCNGSEPEEYKAGISEQRATELLKTEASEKAKGVRELVKVSLNQNQFDALVSFAYNVGIGAFTKSTLLRKLNNGEFDAVPTELKKWVKAGGQTLPGLVRRRNEEAELFTNGTYSVAKSYLGSQSHRQADSGAHLHNNGWSTAKSASDRVLIVLLENGGLDLRLGDLVDRILAAVPSIIPIPDSFRSQLKDYLNKKIRELTDDALESAELLINRYESSAPSLYGQVIILRNGTATFNELRDHLIRKSEEGRLIDLLILTHGGRDYIAAGSGIDSAAIKSIRSANGGKPVRLRQVYMMNCVGSSLNQAWLDIGAKVVSGTVGNNYLPEPTMFYVWNAWKSGMSFSDSVNNAYIKTINDIKNAIIAAGTLLGGPVGGVLADAIADIENRDFVKQSAPLIQGDGSVTIQSDSLSFSKSMSTVRFASTVVPVAAASI